MSQLQTQPNEFTIDSLIDTMIEPTTPAEPTPEADRELDDLIAEVNRPNPNTGFTPAGAVAIEEIKKAVGLTPIVDPDVAEDDPPSGTLFLSDIGRGALRALFGTLGNVAAFPEALADAPPGKRPAIIDAIVTKGTEPISDFLSSIAQSKTLAPDAEATPTLPGFEGVKQAIFTPAWWTNRFPEIAFNSAIFIGTGAGVGKVGRLSGLSRARAARLGQITSLTMITAAETGGSYDNLLKQLLSKDVPEDVARDIAGRGGIAVGVASGLLEMGLINFNLRGANSTRFMRIVRGVAAETAQEEAQLFAQAGIIFIIEEQAQLKLDNGLNPLSAFEAAIGGISGSITGPLITGNFNTLPADTQQAIAEGMAEEAGLPPETAEKFIRDSIEQDPALAEAAKTADPDQPTTPAPTAQPAADPSGTQEVGEGVSEAVAEAQAVKPPAEPESVQTAEDAGVKTTRFTKTSLGKTIKEEFPELGLGSRQLSDTKGLSQADRAEDLLDTSDLGSDFARLLARVFIMDKRGELQRQDIGSVIGVPAASLQEGDTLEIDDAVFRVTKADDKNVTIELVDNPSQAVEAGIIEDDPADRLIETFTIPRDKTIPANAEGFGRPVFAQEGGQVETPQAPADAAGAVEAVVTAAQQPITPPTARRTEATKAATLQTTEIESARRLAEKRSKVDDLGQAVAANLPDILTKAQTANLIQKSLNATTHKQLQSVINETRKRVATARKKAAQTRLKDVIKALDTATLEPETRGAVEELVGSIDLKPLTPSQRKVLESFKSTLERRGEKALPGKKRRQVARLDQKPIGELTEAEANEIADELVGAATQAKAKAKQTQDLKRADIRGSAANIASEIERAADTKTRRFFKRQKERGKVLTPLITMSVGQDAATTPETFIELLSGSDQTAMMGELFKAINAADSRMRARFFKIKDAQNDLIKELGIEDEVVSWLRPNWDYENNKPRKTFTGQVLSAFGRSEPDDGLQVIELPGGKTIELYKAERLEILAQLQDTGTYDLLIHEGVPLALPGMKRGESITLNLQDYIAIIDSATPQEKALATQRVEIMNGTEAADFAKSVFERTGTNPVRPGVYVNRRRVHEPAPGVFEAKTFRQRTIDNAQITLERNPNDTKNPIRITNGFSTYGRWAMMHSAVIEMADPMERAVAILNTPSVKNAIINNHGQESFDRLTRFYDSILRELVGGSGNPSRLDRAIRPLFNSLTRGSLGGRPWVAAYQSGSLGAAATLLNPADIAQATAHRFNEAIDDEITTTSPKLRWRKESGGTQIADNSVREDERLLSEFRATKLSETLGMGMIKSEDWKAIRVIWMASKSQAEREGFKGKAQLERTRQIAEMVVRQSQPDFDVLGMTGLALDARTDIGSRFLNFFRSARSKIVDLDIKATARFSRGQISKTELMRTFFFANIVQGFWIAAVKLVTRNLGKILIGGAAFALTGKGGDEDDDIKVKDEALKLVADTMSANTTSFLFGDLIDGAIRNVFGRVTGTDVGSFDAQLSPASSMFSAIGRSINSIASQTGNERDGSMFRTIKAGARAAEIYLVARGIPVGAPIEAVIDLAETVIERDNRRGPTRGRR